VQSAQSFENSTSEESDMNGLEELTPGKTEAKLWRQRLMDTTDATGDDFKVQRSMLAAVVERQRLDEDVKRRMMSLPIVWSSPTSPRS
jgi:hypothetical protein